MKKAGLIMLLLFLTISLVSAGDLEIKKEKINDVIIKEFDNSAFFNLTFRNLGNADSFELYTLIAVDIFPTGPFELGKNETKTLPVEVKALEGAKKTDGYYTFAYKIKSSTGIQEDMLTIKLVNLKDAFSLTADNINPDDKWTAVHLQNLEEYDFGNMKGRFSSVFFDFEKDFSIGSLQKQSFNTNLDQDKISTLVAGPYLLNADITVGNVSETIEGTLKFLEKSGIATEESKEGFLIARHEISKKNEGNTIAVAEVNLEKGIISRLFTTYNIEPNKAERQGGYVLYTWRQELRPGEILTVIARTNWLVPLIILVIIIIAVVLARLYLTSDLIIKKKINHVKTKGGEFALKVSIVLKARRFVEKINIIDKLPPIVKLYERYGTITPDRVDEKNRRVEWNIESLDQGEETILSYIIYSKIGIVGKFELPSAKGIYERDGKIKETQSNKVFFLSEPEKIKKKIEI